MNSILSSEYQISDPSDYTPLIAKQRRVVHQNPDDEHAWLKLGILLDNRLAAMKKTVENNFFIKHILLLSIAPALLTLFLLHSALSKHQTIQLHAALVETLTIIIISAILIPIAIIRYPRSGARCFKKALVRNPDFGNAYIQLGRIALRKNNLHEACRMFESAYSLKIQTSEVERQLKSFYEKEFMQFFLLERTATKKLEEKSALLQRKVVKMQKEIHSLSTQLKTAKGKANQAKAKASQTVKRISLKMDENLREFKEQYQEKIDSIEKDKIALAEEQAQAKQNFIRITTEITEAKARKEKRAFCNAETLVENAMTSCLWQALSKNTQCYLATAEHVYTHFNNSQHEKDYGLIGMELCKALEHEVNRVLVLPFTTYLADNRDDFLRVSQVGTKNNKPVYFTFLSKIVDQKNFPEVNSLTLGQYCFVLSQALSNDYSLNSYSDFLANLQKVKGLGIDTIFLENLNIVTNKYRNTIAHNSIAMMSQGSCKHLRGLVFAGNNALLKTIASINLGKAQSGNH